MKKKLLSIIATLSLLVTLSSAPLAAGSDKLIDVATALVSHYTRVIEQEEFPSGTKVSIGNAVPAFTVKNGNVQSYRQAEYHPVLLNGSCIGILTVHNPENPAYTYGTEFSNKLNELIQSQSNQFCFIVENDGIYLKTEADANLLQRFFDADVADDVNPLSESTLGSSGKSYNGLTFKYTSFEDIKQEVPLKTQTNRAAADNIFLGVGRNVQPDPTTCWATSLMQIGKYVASNYDYTPMDIRNEMKYYGGATPVQQRIAMHQIYGLKKYLNDDQYINDEDYVLDDHPDDIKTVLNAEKPISAYGEGPGNSAHWVTVCGYDCDVSSKYNPRMMIDYSDPWTGQYKVAYPDSSGTFWLDTTERTVYEWTASVFDASVLSWK